MATNGIELEYYNQHQPRVIDETGGGMLDDHHHHHHHAQHQPHHYHHEALGDHVAAPQDAEPPAAFTETDLTLMCLDYMRDLRRTFPADVLEEQEGIRADYLTLACWALNRALQGAPTLAPGNDCFTHPKGSKTTTAPTTTTVRHQHKIGNIALPMAWEEIEQEILQSDNAPNDNEDSKKEEEEFQEWYDYDDQHQSNVHRFYPLGGLASGPSWPGPLTLGEITTAACLTLKAKTRLQAEQELIQSELFDQFVQAVQEKDGLI